jgi:Uma2 family endonuclease
MVAKTSIAERFKPPPQELIDGQVRLAEFTRQDAEAMVRMGIIPEDASTELLHGMIVLKNRARRGQDPMTIGNDHRICVVRLTALNKRIDGPTRHVESQQPLVCAETHVPEPDFMVIPGAVEEESDLPTAADAFCVVEVADDSYERDAGMKRWGYARAGVKQHIIINLRNRTAEIYTQPDTAAGTYPPPQVINEAGELPLRVGEDEFLPIRLRDVLP